MDLSITSILFALHCKAFIYFSLHMPNVEILDLILAYLTVCNIVSVVYLNYLLSSSNHVQAMTLLKFAGNTSRGVGTPSDLNLPAGCALTNS